MGWLQRGMLGVVCASGMACPAIAMDVVRLTLEQHRFQPDQATVAAGQRFQIEVTNQDPTPSEIESRELRIEKIVPPGSKVTVSAGPLRPGRYQFFDEYHPETATGTIIAVER